MHLEFELGPLRISARYRPAVPGRRVGHPDRWTEGESEEIEILSVLYKGKELNPDDIGRNTIDEAVREVVRQRGGDEAA